MRCNLTEPYKSHIKMQRCFPRVGHLESGAKVSKVAVGHSGNKFLHSDTMNLEVSTKSCVGSATEYIIKGH